eukprot:scaffold8709_cov62-Phaeocystis_antarctica.AAC.4
MAGLTAKSLGSGSNIRTAARGALARTHPGGDSVYDGSSARTESMANERRVDRRRMDGRPLLRTFGWQPRN